MDSMKIEFSLEDILEHVYEDTSDEDLHLLFELLCNWKDKVSDEIDYVASLEVDVEDDEWIHSDKTRSMSSLHQ